MRASLKEGVCDVQAEESLCAVEDKGGAKLRALSIGDGQSMVRLSEGMVRQV